MRAVFATGRANSNGREILSLKNVKKRFSGVIALQGVDFSLQAGEIHALCGENGAGKTTLIKILSGVYPHGDFEGEYLLDGKSAHFSGVQDSLASGLSVIYQELPLVGQLSVAANMFLGHEPRKSGPWPVSLLLDESRMQREAKQVLSRFGIALDPSRLVQTLGAGQKQLVEIARALRNETRVLILDEPTAALTERESEALGALLRELRQKGQGIVYISHRLEEVMALSDRITVLRDGKTVYCDRTKHTTQESLVKHMVGRDVGDLFPAKKPTHASGETVLQTSRLTVAHRVGGAPRLSDISFSVRAGEIVGIYGLLGAGRSELLLHLFGAWGHRLSGTVKLLGRPHAPKGPPESIAAGLLLVTEDRRRYGLLLSESVRSNMTLSSLGKFLRRGFVDTRLETHAVRKMASELRVRAASLLQPVATLSGGNQQKVVLGKALLCGPKVLLLDEPTRGVDVGAKQETYALLDRLRQNGMGVLLVSSELPELLGLSDRLLVLSDGTLTDCGKDATPERLLQLALGLGQAVHT